LNVGTLHKNQLQTSRVFHLKQKLKA